MEFEEKLFSREQIQKRVEELGAEISADYQGKEILLVCVLKGAFIFMADLIREIKVPVSMDFISVSSYGASTKSSGVVRLVKDLETDITGKDVIIVEDIMDSGVTINWLRENFLSRQANTVKVACMLNKQARRRVPLKPDYFGFDIEDKFIIGYGLDFDQKGRELPDIWALKEN